MSSRIFRHGFPQRSNSKSKMAKTRPTRTAIAVMVGALLLTVAVGIWRAPECDWDLGLLRGPARLLDLQRPDRGVHRVEGEDLRQLPGAGGRDGLPRRHPGGADRRRHDPHRLAALARRVALPAQQRPHLRLLPAGRRHRLPRGSRRGRPDARGPVVLPLRLRALPARPGDQLRDDRQLRLLRRALLLLDQAAGAAAGAALGVRERDARRRRRLHLPRDRARRDRPLRRRPRHLPVPARPAPALPAAGRASWSCAASSWPASRSGC